MVIKCLASSIQGLPVKPVGLLHTQQKTNKQKKNLKTLRDCKME